MLTPGMRQAAQISETSAVKIKAQFDKVGNKGRTMGASLNELKNRLEAVNQVRFSTQFSKEFDTATRAAQRLERQIGKLEAKGNGKTAFSLGGSLGGLAAGYGALELGKQTIGAAANREQQQISFEVMTGSKETGNKLLNDLVNMGARTPFTSSDLIKNAELLKGFGVETEKILPTLNVLGNISRGNADKLGLMSLAYAQATSAGRLMGQDLLQMVNAGFNPLQQMIKDKVFPNMNAARKAMEDGAISAKMLEAAFQSATGPGGMFNNMMARQAQTISGRWSTIIDNTQMRLISLGQTLRPVISAVLTFTSALLAGEPYAIAMVVAVGALALGIWGAGAATKAWAVAQAILNAVMLANPIFLIISAIAALAAVVLYAYNHFTWFRGAIYGAWEGMKQFATTIKEYVITRLKELLSGITGIGQTLLYFFKGEWSKAWETGKNATKDLLGVGSKEQAYTNAKKIGDAVRAGYKDGASSLQIKLGATDPKKANAGSAIAAKADYGSLPVVSSKADSINQGGQRNITIHIAKQIETIENHIIGGGKEVADAIEDAVREAMRRVMYSINAEVAN